MNKAIFLDKDGTLIYDVPYNVDPHKIKFYEDAFDALRLLVNDDYKIIVVSNQSGVAQGYFGETDVKYIEQEIRKALHEHGIALEGFYYCPHHPTGKVATYTLNCDCRKPAPGMILRAAEEHYIELSDSWMVGDILNDVEAGNAAFCKTVLIDNGGETEWIRGEKRTPHLVVKTLMEAAQEILKYQDMDRQKLENKNLWNN